MAAYYNEIDPEAVEVLKELVKTGVIAPGDVDGRSIKEVSADDVRGYIQCHFFAGAGLWSVAARLARWPDSRAIWTASCPCQGESLAGKRLGADDPRHLWPDLYRLIRAVRPAVIVGEQVAAAAGTHWLDGMCANLEDEDYASRAVDIPACCIDAPHQRNRLYWIALANAQEQRGGAGLCQGGTVGHRSFASDSDGSDILLADPESIGRRREFSERGSQGRTIDGRVDADGSMEHAAGERRGQGSAAADIFRGRTTVASADVCEHQSLAYASGDGRQISVEGRQSAVAWPVGLTDSYSNGSWWADAEWIGCHDQKARRAKPGIPMLVDGMAGRASVWRLAGNSIVPQLAAEVIASIDETDLALTQG